MNYRETLKYINDTPKFSKILGNDDLKKLLAKLGNPQGKLQFIHVAGTNGKGSVSAMLASILRASGKKCGLYTSPFIEVFNERIQVDGENIKDNDLARIATRVKKEIDALGVEISVFAQITAMAFLYFAEQNCDIIVLETGLGGRLDATNVIASPTLAIITKIGLDHTEYLGETIEKIAEEKCGIIKPGTKVITTSHQKKSVLSIIENTCKNLNVPLFVAEPTSEYSLSLKGEYQKENAGIAVCGAKALGISDEHIKEGLLNTKWIARFEYLADNLILDGGHNPDGVRALISSLKALNKPVTFVVAMMQDKDVCETSMLIKDFAKNVIVTEVKMPRCMKAEELATLFPHCQIEKDSISAVKKAISDVCENELICVCGSLYLAGEIRGEFL
ncbi:MAG: bifunctional folylpolyglutamate synthase/dihydrofolate synthase [Clostridia bacterium]|nr:bifunctional folylpolyglutamate synthase/dihydrofolate synthase [Clostridia bacterium]